MLYIHVCTSIVLAWYLVNSSNPCMLEVHGWKIVEACNIIMYMYVHAYVWEPPITTAVGRGALCDEHGPQECFLTARTSRPHFLSQLPISAHTALRYWIVHSFSMWCYDNYTRVCICALVHTCTWITLQYVCSMLWYCVQHVPPTISAAPIRKFTIAFKMFDLNGDGHVDVKEFDQVQIIIYNNPVGWATYMYLSAFQVREVIMNSTAIGERHRDHMVTGSVAGPYTSCCIIIICTYITCSLFPAIEILERSILLVTFNIIQHFVSF